MGLLTSLGVPAEVEKLYSAMPQPPADVEVETFIHALSSGANHRRILDELKTFGLAHELPDGRWRPTPVAVAVAVLHSRQADQWAALARTVTALQANADGRGDGSELDAVRDGRVEVLTTQDTVMEFHDQVCSNATGLRGFDRPPYVFSRDNVPEVTFDYLKAHSPEFNMLLRGGTIQTVYHPGFADLPHRYDEWKLFRGAGEESRLAEVDTKLVMFHIGDKITITISNLLRMHERAEAAARGEDPTTIPPRVTVIHDHPLLAEVFGNIFDLKWKEAIRLSLPSDKPGDNGGDTSRVARLLLEGMEQKQISSELRLSIRSVGRRIDKLKEMTQAKSREQLGARLRDLERDGLLEKMTIEHDDVDDEL